MIRYTQGNLLEAPVEWSAGAAAAERKQRLFSDRILSLAIERLQSVALA